jgi:hypothetical protein
VKIIAQNTVSRYAGRRPAVEVKADIDPPTFLSVRQEIHLLKRYTVGAIRERRLLLLQHQHPHNGQLVIAAGPIILLFEVEHRVRDAVVDHMGYFVAVEPRSEYVRRDKEEKLCPIPPSLEYPVSILSRQGGIERFGAEHFSNLLRLVD